MRRLFAALLIAAGLSVGLVGVANADPITCPPGQTSQQVSPGNFQCVNNGDSGDPNTEDSRNPNK
jgi:hypothetical protein